MSYEFIEHTADIGLAVDAPDLEGLLVEAASGMFELAGVKTAGKGDVYDEITVSGADREDLLVNWLSELLFRFDARRLVPCSYTIHASSDTQVTATLGQRVFETGSEESARDIKAVTYYGLQVSPHKGRCQATVVFDI